MSLAPPPARLAALLLSLLLAAPAHAQSVGLAVETPLGGYYRAGSWIPLCCTLTNQGPPAEVQLTARLQEYGPNGAEHDYELSASLPSPANRRYFLYVKPSSFYGTRPTEVRLTADRRLIARQEPSLNALNVGDRLIAVLAPQEGGFGSLAGIRIPSRGNPFPQYGPRNSNGGQVQIAYVKPELAPDRPVGYQVADLVVASSLPSGALSAAQEQALIRWVQAGGTLVVTGGGESGALQSPALRAVLPVEITGTTTLDARSALRALASSYPPPASGGYPAGGAGSAAEGGTFVATASRPKPGAAVIEARPGVPLLAAWLVGAGRVVFLAADPARPPFRGGDALAGLWRHYLLSPPPTTRYLTAIEAEAQLSGVPGGYAPPNYPYTQQPTLLANACQQVSQMDVPGVAFIGLFLLAYIVMLVPVNYYVLKRRDRRELAWVSTPAIILAFSGLAYGVGYGTKGGQVVLAQIGIVEAWAGQSAAPALSYLGLFSPRKTSYDLSAADGSVPLMPAEGGNSYRLLRVAEGEGFGLKELPVDMWDMALFRADSVVDLGEGFQCRLRLAGDKLTGRVTNRTPFDLENAALLVGGNHVVLWGTFRRGETRTVSAPGYPIGTGSALLPPAVLETLHGTRASDRMRRALLEPLTTGSSGGPPGYGVSWSPPDHPVLLGWVNRPLLPTRVDGHPVQDQAAHLFLVHLPVR